MAKKQPITPRDKDYSKWYTDIITVAELADYSPVKGCMVIRPYGYALWEAIQRELDGKIKATGHQNAYFPMFIPKSFLEKEAEHVEGFAKECAIVTHHRLTVDEKNKKLIADPSAKLEEELIVRPTSETIINSMYAKWVQSYRDLPILINQWANVVRWEMRTRLFLRTAEFLWQEGHTVHATEEEAEEETLKMLEVYRQLLEDFMAIPVIQGRKTEKEKFAGALRTYTVEAMMQDRKALQAGTSHNLGQNFAKAFEIRYQDKDGKLQYAWQTSWGVSTRLIGALIMTHSDDRGLVLPPRLAPIQVVFVPIWKQDKEKELVLKGAKELKESLVPSIRTHLDTRDQMTVGAKFFEWEKKGVPIRIEIGPRDMKEEKCVLVRRDSGEKIFVCQKEAPGKIQELLEEIQTALFERAKKFREENTTKIDSWKEFESYFEAKGGFALCHHCGDRECEEAIQEKTKVTIRCIPLDNPKEKGKCIYCGKESGERVVFAQSY
ncbi:MAG: proline--tRNA ligase [Planctomycetota bacterium]|nr:MAG: proline--tRNA ligase [Planctomycetota bacterium]